jgi:hypothetical protein
MESRTGGRKNTKPKLTKWDNDNLEGTQKAKATSEQFTAALMPPFSKSKFAKNGK